MARALDGRYARAADEAYALVREAVAASGDIIPGPVELLIRLDPLTAPRPWPPKAIREDDWNVVRCELECLDMGQRIRRLAMTAGQSLVATSWALPGLALVGPIGS